MAVTGPDAGDDAASGDAASGPVLTDNPAESRYEARVGGELAGYIIYRLRDTQITLVHTEVDPRFQGGGLASHLARFCLDDARKRNLAVIPTCPYVRSWIGRHPGYADLVPADRRAEFGL